MILVDTSIWIDHLRKKNDDLVQGLQQGKVVIHPFVIGEIAMGNLSRRSLLDDFWMLPMVEPLADRDVIAFVEQHKLHGRGIGLVDAHLLASCWRHQHKLWTADRRLASIAAEISLALTDHA